MTHFEKVKNYLLDLEYEIVLEDKIEEVLIVNKESKGIKNLVIDCEDPILIIEQMLFEVKQDSLEMYKSLLQKNADIIHGAFVLTSDGKRVMFRDTLQLENLDLNELEASINSLSLLLSEYYEELLKFSKQQ
ncbi:MAG: YbjN domain-containing protein [Cytophagales bacterium]|nr:YbjN domain-containing protein [Cytophagales bacterium]MDW8383479.1 YbjN domain-containing protein [Flammeovirgaceae bacterium]